MSRPHKKFSHISALSDHRFKAPQSFKTETTESVLSELELNKLLGLLQSDNPTESAQARGDLVMAYMHLIEISALTQTRRCRHLFPDAVQEVTCKLLSENGPLSRYQVERGTRFPHFISAVAKNEVIDYLRRELPSGSSSHQPVRHCSLQDVVGEADSDLTLQGQLSSGEPDAFAVCSAKEIWTQILSRVSEFSEKQQIALLMLIGRANGHDIPVEEIAANMGGVTTSTANVHIHATRAQLRKKWPNALE